jgi:hypothetical protein
MIGIALRLSRRALEFWRNHQPELPWNRRYRALVVEDLPDRLERKKLYVVGGRSCPQYAAMACPHRRCATVLTMNLLPDDDPQWQLALDRQAVPTLAPSIWRRQDCGCHFFLREGRLTWCE